MHVYVGSQNPRKIEAVHNVFSTYFHDVVVLGVAVESGVPAQPMEKEIYRGAFNRAVEALHAHPMDGTYGVGLEGGLISMPGEAFPRLNITACAIYDADGAIGYGTSSGFLIPTSMAELIARDKIDLDTASYKSGITKDPRVGDKGGVIPLFTRGRVTRQHLLEQAVAMALIPFLNKDLF